MPSSRTRRFALQGRVLRPASASTRPALSHATSVTSTEWHSVRNQPIRIAEPGRISTSAYSASGVTAHTTQASSDTTGAGGFNATPSGPQQRTDTSLRGKAARWRQPLIATHCSNSRAR